MKTLCEVKRKDIARHFDATAAALRDGEQASPGYLCRDCLRYSCDKKRLCDPISLKKLKHEPERSETPESQ
jgi:hypothetical protein